MLSIEKEGAVSESVVRAMAENSKRILDTDYSVATSGIAGPDGGSAKNLWEQYDCSGIRIWEPSPKNMVTGQTGCQT